MQYSVVSKNQIERSVFGDRIDAEFYLPIYLNVESTIEKHGYDLLNSITSKIDVGHVGPMVNEYTNAGVWLLQTQNVKTFFLDESNKIFINQQFHEYLKKSKVRKGDVLIARTGSFGTACIYLENDEINSADVIIIKPQDQLINPYYLVTYLNSRFGTNQLLRFASGGLQGHVNLTILENLKVCKIDSSLQNQIEQIVKGSYNQRKNSEQLTADAQALLLSELRLSNWRPKHQLSFVKNYSDTDNTGRIDADYFQPKYDEIVKAIKGYSAGWDTLENIASVTKCIEVGSEAYMDEGDIPFVRVSDISPFEITEEKYISDSLYAELSQHQPKEGEILLSKDGSPGIAYHLNEKPRKMIPSGGILRLKVKNTQINEDYLTLVLNSMIVQEQINRDVGGSVILHWRPEQVKQTLIPILNNEKQNDIQQKITEAFDLRKQSKRLLECAKRAVELAIEQDEKAAVKWLQEKTN